MAREGEKKSGKTTGDIESASAVFTWKNLNYVRPASLLDRPGQRLTSNARAPQTVGNNIHLLNDISGYCRVRQPLLQPDPCREG